MSPGLIFNSNKPKKILYHNIMVRGFLKHASRLWGVLYSKAMGVKKQKLFLFLLIWSLNLAVCPELIFADTSRLTSLLPAPSCDSAGDPSLNDKGEVVFKCDDRYFFYNAISFTDLTPVIANFISSLPVVSFSRLNHLSQIAFIGQDKDTGRYDIYLYEAGNITNITAESDISVPPYFSVQSETDGTTTNYRHPLYLNDSGQIAFIGQDKDTGRYDIYLYGDSHIINITSGTDISLVYIDNNTVFLPNPQLNNNGQMVFQGKDASTDRRDIYFYDGSDVSNLTTSLVILPSSPRLNNGGQIAFAGQDPFSNRYDVYFYDGNTISNVTADLDIAAGSPVLNNEGKVVFAARDANGAPNIYLFDGSTVTNITLNSDIRDIFSNLNLNDKDQIAFMHWDISANVINLNIYDDLSPQKVTSIRGSPTGMQLNNRGQIVFISITARISQFGSDLLFFYDGQELKQVTNIYCPCESLSLNDKDQIAFASSQSGVHIYDEGNIKSISTGLKPVGSPLAISLNNHGQIAFLATNNLCLYTSSTIRNITADLNIVVYRDPWSPYNSFPSLNDNGQIAFVASDSAVQTSLYFYDGTKVDKINTEGIIPFSPPSLNDNGQIAFFATDTVGLRGIYLYDNSSTTSKFNVDDSSSNLTLNNKGQIAYEALGGIYFYDGTKVMNITEGLGDIKTEYSVTKTRPTLNNKGQITFAGYDVTSKILYFYLYDSASTDKIKIIKKFQLSQPDYDIPLSLNDKTQLAFILSRNQIYLANPLPVAQSGSDQTLSPGNMVSVDGSGSYDLDGDSLNYRWVILSRPLGSEAILSDPKASEPTFVADTPGIYELQLIVDDGKERSDPDSVLITVVNPADQRPLAYGGRDRVVTTGNTITLDGTATYNPLGEDLSYTWSLLTKPTGSQTTLTGPTSKNPSLKIDGDGLYQISLLVRNSYSESVPNTISIFGIGKDAKLTVKTNNTEYRPGDNLEVFIWAGNSGSEKAITTDAFIGFGLPDGSLYFFDDVLSLKDGNPVNPSSFIPFAQNVTLSPGFVFPTSAEMNADSDGNGKLDAYRLFSLTLPPTLPAGPYFAFAALAEPGSTQAGSPQLLSPISLTYFSITH